MPAFPPGASQRGGQAAAALNRQGACNAYSRLYCTVLDLRGRGRSLAGIAAELNRLGERTRTGRPWNKVQVARVLCRARAADVEGGIVTGPVTVAGEACRPAVAEVRGGPAVTPAGEGQARVQPEPAPIPGPGRIETGLPAEAIADAEDLASSDLTSLLKELKASLAPAPGGSVR